MISCEEDHPRSRGVYLMGSERPPSAGGSSPLARGLLVATADRSARLRIIPARAGFTTGRAGRRSCPWDHPRSRGVYGSMHSTESSSRGSSPLARGLPEVMIELTGKGRIIPARAGFTCSLITTALAAPDHPRSRGVYPPGQDGDTVIVGSSPLARGLPRAGTCARRRARIIPARAGFTSRLATSA